jgi:hypothetical protein
MPFVRDQRHGGILSSEARRWWWRRRHAVSALGASRRDYFTFTHLQHDELSRKPQTASPSSIAEKH